MLSAVKFEKVFRYMDLFWQGVACTVSLSALTVIFGFILALILAVARLSDLNVFRFLSTDAQRRLQNREGFWYALSRFNPIKFIATAYVELFRATPMLVQLFVIYYVVFANVSVLPGFKLFGFIRFDRFFPGVVALALNSGAYLSEIIRSGIQSIDGGQTEAARSLGMSQLKTMRFIILPQAIKNVLPALANEVVTMIKESSICMMLGMGEIMFAAQTISGSTYISVGPYMLAAIIYFVINYPTSKVIEHIERRMRRGDKH